MNRTIFIFDLDDTLVKTGAKIKVYSDEGNLVHSLTPEEFNSYVNHNGHTLDFDDFNDLQILLGGVLMMKNVKILKDCAKIHDVGMITARSHRMSVLEFIREKNLPIKENLIYVVNDPRAPFNGTVAERKKQAFEMLIKMGYDNFIYYDDNTDNLEAAKSLEQEYSVKFELHHVKD